MKQTIINENSPYYELFKHMNIEHGLILLDSEMQDIIHIINKKHNINMNTAYLFSFNYYYNKPLRYILIYALNEQDARTKACQQLLYHSGQKPDPNDHQLQLCTFGFEPPMSQEEFWQTLKNQKP